MHFCAALTAPMIALFSACVSSGRAGGGGTGVANGPGGGGGRTGTTVPWDGGSGGGIGSSGKVDVGVVEGPGGGLVPDGRGIFPQSFFSVGDGGGGPGDGGAGSTSSSEEGGAFCSTCWGAAVPSTWALISVGGGVSEGWVRRHDRKPARVPPMTRAAPKAGPSFLQLPLYRTGSWSRRARPNELCVYAFLPGDA